MKKVLIIEDDDFKLGKLTAFLAERYPNYETIIARSVQTGKSALRDIEVDFLILDMSLPAFDEAYQRSGGRPQNFGGRELLGYLDYLEKYIPTVILTMFEAFGEGKNLIDLDTLRVELQSDYGEVFKGLIFYSQISDDWKKKLSIMIEEQLNKE